MRPSSIHFLAGGATCVMVFGLSAVPTLAKTLKQCAAQYAANKENIDAAGLTRDGFIGACRINQTKESGERSSGTTSNRPIPAGGIKAPLSRD
jgi:hypothetical protein